MVLKHPTHGEHLRTHIFELFVELMRDVVRKMKHRHVSRFPVCWLLF